MPVSQAVLIVETSNLKPHNIDSRHGNGIYAPSFRQNGDGQNGTSSYSQLRQPTRFPSLPDNDTLSALHVRALSNLDTCVS